MAIDESRLMERSDNSRVDGDISAQLYKCSGHEKMMETVE